MWLPFAENRIEICAAAFEKTTNRCLDSRKDAECGPQQLRFSAQSIHEQNRVPQSYAAACLQCGDALPGCALEPQLLCRCSRRSCVHLRPVASLSPKFERSW